MTYFASASGDVESPHEVSEPYVVFDNLKSNSFKDIVISSLPECVGVSLILRSVQNPHYNMALLRREDEIRDSLTGCQSPYLIMHNVIVRQ